MPGLDLQAQAVSVGSRHICALPVGRFHKVLGGALSASSASPTKMQALHARSCHGKPRSPVSLTFLPALSTPAQAFPPAPYSVGGPAITANWAMGWPGIHKPFRFRSTRTFRWGGSISAGGAITQERRGHSCGVTTGAWVECWGYNATGQLGTGDFGPGHLTPTRVVSLPAHGPHHYRG